MVKYIFTYRLSLQTKYINVFSSVRKSITHGYTNGSFPLTTFPSGNRPVCQKKIDTGNSGTGISAHNVRNHVNPSQWLYLPLSVSEKDNGTRLYQALLLLLSVLFLVGIQNREMHFSIFLMAIITRNQK